ncbi:MAG TPA: MFS transporter [Bacillota bacterium]|nr:MFS transporter [Bacillota bacterium]HOA15413.1 MFS transporter [Bacillota bacterium]HOG52704.1 MFS transporter [Bacillota bacterium]
MGYVLHKREGFKGGSPNRLLIVAACSACFFISNLHRISPGIIANELMREFGASASVLGFLSSSYFYTYALLQLPVGLLCDRYRPGLVMGTFMAAGALGCFIFAASRTLFMALAGRVLLSAGVAAVFIPSVRIFDFAYRGAGASMATGILMAVGNIGGMSASGPLAYAVVNYGWRGSMYVIGSATLAVGLAAMLATMRLGFRSKGKDSVEAEGFSPRRGRKEYLVILAGLSAAILLQYGSQMGYQGLWGVPFITDVYGWTKTQAGNLIMLASMGAALGAPMTGWLIAKKGFSIHRLLVASAVVILASWLPVVIRHDPSDLSSLAIGTFLIGWASAFTAILNPEFARRFISEDSRGAFLGIYNSASMAGGAIFQPLMGFVIDRSVSSGAGLAAGYFSALRLGLASSALVLAIRVWMYYRYTRMDSPISRDAR